MSPGADERYLITVPEATAEQTFEEKFSGLKKELEEQRKLSWQIIIGVGAAFILTIGIVAVEVILFHTR